MGGIRRSIERAFVGRISAVRGETAGGALLKSGVCFRFFCSLTSAFLVFHDSSPLAARGSRLNSRLAAAVSGNAQVIPVDTVTTRAQFLPSFILYTEVFGRPYYCYLEHVFGATKIKAYKTRGL